MSERFKQLLVVLGGIALILVGAARLFDDFLQARRFVRYGVEKQATILELDHMIGGKSPQYVYSLQIDQTTVLKTFPYNWTLPIKRSFLVLADSPRADDIALGNHNSSTVVVMCYMEGCDKPGNLLLYPLMLILFAVMVPYFGIKLLKNPANP
jgi:hypothetical protein